MRVDLADAARLQAVAVHTPLIRPCGPPSPAEEGKKPPILAHLPALCLANTNTKPRRGYLQGSVHRGVGKYIKVSECLD